MKNFFDLHDGASTRQATEAPVELLDVETVLRVSEAISAEVDTERLIETLLIVALERAGAQRGVLFLYKDNRLDVRAQARLSSTGVTVSLLDGTQGPSWPCTLLTKVERSLSCVLLDDASRSSDFIDEEYFQRQQTRSVLCVPLLSRANLVGVLYLEAELVKSAFTNKHAAVVRLAAAQAAIALENSGLYLALKRENRDRKLAEDSAERTARALRESEGRFRNMADATPAVIWISEAEPERVLYVNPSFEHIWGVTAESLYEDAHVWVQGIHPEDRTRIASAFRTWLQSGGRIPWDVEFRVLQPMGAIRWIHERGVFLPEEPGLPRRISGIATDVTAQRTAVLALQQSEERNSLAMEAARDGHWDWTAATDDFYASPRMLEIYGFSTDTRFHGRQDFLDRFPFYPGDRLHWESAIEEHFSSDRSRFEMELRLIRHGEVRWIQLHGLTTRDGGGRPVRYTGSVSDITERKAGEAALRESEQRFALATEGSSDGIYDWDLETDLLYLSPRCQALYGLEPSTPSRARQEWIAKISIHPEDAVRQQTALEDYLAGLIPTYDNEWRVLHADGIYRWIRLRGVCLRDEDGRATRIAGSVSDVDARRRAEAAMQQMHRLEAVGTLAGGVAHDFNNILAVILGFGESSLRHTRPGSRMRRDLERILSAGERGRALVERILAFSRSSVGARVAVDVEGVIAESMMMIEAMCPPQVRIETRLNSGKATMLGDPTQLHQVLMNLATNGMQAMPDGGSLLITLSRENHADERMTTTGPLPRGSYVVISVQDSGEGIDPAIKDRIFDPFFTTKDVGTGTGLGLSLVHGIVAELGGAIDVYSELGAGCIFTAYLPYCAEPGDSHTREDDFKPIPSPSGRGRKKRVLVVDDEESLVQLNHVMLADLGYSSQGFTSPMKALAAFRKERNSFDVVLTDLRMPSMSGLQLIGALREISSDIPIVLASGFLVESCSEQARDAGANLILNKPISKRDLAVALSGLLRSRRRAAPAK